MHKYKIFDNDESKKKRKNDALEQETDTSQSHKNCYPERLMGNFSDNVHFQGGS